MTMNITTQTNTAASSKPKWVECLERAEAELDTRLDGQECIRAQQWMELARLYKG